MQVLSIAGGLSRGVATRRVSYGHTRREVAPHPPLILYMYRDTLLPEYYTQAGGLGGHFWRWAYASSPIKCRTPHMIM